MVPLKVPHFFEKNKQSYQSRVAPGQSTAMVHFRPDPIQTLYLQTWFVVPWYLLEMAILLASHTLSRLRRANSVQQNGQFGTRPKHENLPTSIGVRYQHSLKTFALGLCFLYYQLHYIVHSTRSSIRYWIFVSRHMFRLRILN